MISYGIAGFALLTTYKSYSKLNVYLSILLLGKSQDS